MTPELKQKIFYSEVINKLLCTTKVLAIYLGGSRLLGLDSPNSDYDIVVITKDNTLNNYQRRPLHIDNLNIHLHIQSLKVAVPLIKYPKTLKGFETCLMLIDILECPEEMFLYKSKAFETLRESLKPYREPLIILCLETRLNGLYNKIHRPIVRFSKVHYHYLLTHFMLNNFLETKEFMLTYQQATILKAFKTTGTITPAFMDSLNNRYPHKYFTSKYTYEDIYKEVKLYE